MFNIAFEKDGQTRHYCLQWAERSTMERMLELFIRRYGNGVDDLRPYPNGKGVYHFTNPRIVEKEN